jgi:flavin reductase (DIM6/NTAB) family NADH-FMN oxidoreductase RutF
MMLRTIPRASHRDDVNVASLIGDCPITMECRLVSVVDLPINEVFVGEILGAYADTDCLSEGKPDIKKIRPFTLTMPDSQYWEVGGNAAVHGASA